MRQIHINVSLGLKMFANVIFNVLKVKEQMQQTGQDVILVRQVIECEVGQKDDDTNTDANLVGIVKPSR